MQRYLIQRDLPGVGSFTPAQLQAIAKTSNGVLCEMGSGIQWEHSYITGDKIFCVYLADSEEKIREHAKRGGFPCTQVTQVNTIIGPLTENGPA
jgi:hypothetical protein